MIMTDREIWRVGRQKLCLLHHSACKIVNEMCRTVTSMIRYALV